MAAPSPPSPPVPRYHIALRDHLQRAAPELWQWFAHSMALSRSDTQAAELELLKTSYRLEPTTSTLGATATIIAGQLGLECPVICYQALRAQESNASVQILGDANEGFTIHVAFSGEILDRLSSAEQQAVLAHELAHVDLLMENNGDFRILSEMVERLASQSASHPALDETARRLRLHTEVHADAVSVAATGDRDQLISALVKTESGLRTVDPTAYIKQAEQILLSESSATASWTHPELHIRVACLVANTSRAADGPNHQLVARLIEGPDDLDRLDVLGQDRLQDLASSVLSAAVDASGTPEGFFSVIEAFESNAGVDQLLASLGHQKRLLKAGERVRSVRIPNDGLASAQPSVRTFCAALLVDLTLASDHASRKAEDHSGQDDPDRVPRALAAEASRLGIAAEFDRVLAKAISRPLADVRRLRS